MALSKIKHCTECVTAPGNPVDLWVRGASGKMEPQLQGSHRSQGITERHFAAIATSPGVSPQPRNERGTQPVFCREDPGLEVFSHLGSAATGINTCD